MKIAVIGTGSWGTALAQLLATKGCEVTMRARRDEVSRAINEEHRNPRYLVDSSLSPNVTATTSYEEAVSGASAILLVTPSNVVRETAAALSPFCGPDVPVVICSKGLEQGTGALLSKVCADELGNAQRIAVLSGPNHAEEVIQGVPAGSVIAAENPELRVRLQGMFSTTTFRTYASDDIVGMQLCAAFKNVIAISVGISYGLGFGDNTASLLITRGLAEMSRLIKAAGGNPLTALGLAGTGDMIATCMSKHSRNRTFGEAFARGESLDSYYERTHMVVEGALACKSLKPLSEKYGIELPITYMVRALLWEGVDVSRASDLLLRPLKHEQYGM